MTKYPPGEPIAYDGMGTPIYSWQVPDMPERPEEKLTRPWPENSWPTATQWRDWFVRLSPQQQLEVSDQLVRNAQTSARCADYRHIESIHRLQADNRKLSLMVYRFRDAWRSSRRRAASLRDEVARLSDDAARGIPSSQSDPESLPSSDEKPIASHRADRSARDWS